jgi:hypothetical protein
MSSFTVKKLRATLVLADSANVSFTATQDNTLILTGNRMSARVLSNARQATQLSLRIWGMKLADMDAMTAAWLDPNAIRNNIVILEADDGHGFRPVFSGTIIEAQPDFRAAPDVPFQVLATIRYFQQIQVVEPVSYKGDVDVAVLGRYIADKLDMSYEQSPEVRATLTDPYFPGSIWNQLNAICKAARVDYYFQGDKLIFTPISLPFDSKPAAVLTPNTGLIGYPMYSRRGLVVTAIFDPAFLCGTAIEIQDSLVKGANGRWYPYSIEHTLEAELPGGKWLSTMQCLRAGT